MTDRIASSESEMIDETKKNYKDYLVDFIKAIVCSYYNKDVNDFNNNSSKRKREYSMTRQIIFYLVRENSEITYMELGRKFEKDHATVMYACKTIKGLMEWDKVLSRQIKELQELITLRAKASVSNLNIEDDFYFVDLNEVTSLKVNKKKAIVLVGFSEEEIKRMEANLPEGTERRDLVKTGMYILENKVKP